MSSELGNVFRMFSKYTVGRPRDYKSAVRGVNACNAAMGAPRSSALAASQPRTYLQTTDQRLINLSSEMRGKHVSVDFSKIGLLPAVFTPLNDDQTINFNVIDEYAHYIVKNGMKSILVLGTTGESQTMSVTNKKKLIDYWVQYKKSLGLHVMVQVGGAPFQDVLDVTRYCESIGVDSLLCLPELYFKPTSVSELVDYVEAVCRAAPSLPLLYYHNPKRSNVEIHMPSFVVAATERVPNFKGIKYAANDLSECAQVMRVLKEDQDVFLANETLLAPAALLGITSSTTTTFNLFPKVAQDILDAVKQGDVSKARQLQEQLSLAVESILREGNWVPAMKAARELVSGIKLGPPLLPQRPVPAEGRDRIQAQLKKLNII